MARQRLANAAHWADHAQYDQLPVRVDRTITLVQVLADALRPAPEDTSTHPWIIDATLIPVHDQSMGAISKNHRRSINTQIIICAHRRRVVLNGRCWPGNRNDVIVARHTVAQLLEGRVVLGDSGISKPTGNYGSTLSAAAPRRSPDSAGAP